MSYHGQRARGGVESRKRIRWGAPQIWNGGYDGSVENEGNRKNDDEVGRVVERRRLGVETARR